MTKLSSHIKTLLIIPILTALTFALPAQAITEKELIKELGKDKLIEFIREQRNGNISFIDPATGYVNNMVGKPSTRLITDKSIKKDLKKLKMTPDEVLAQLAPKPAEDETATEDESSKGETEPAELTLASIIETHTKENVVKTIREFNEGMISVSNDRDGEIVEINGKPRMDVVTERTLAKDMETLDWDIATLDEKIREFTNSGGPSEAEQEMARATSEYAKARIGQISNRFYAYCKRSKTKQYDRDGRRMVNTQERCRCMLRVLKTHMAPEDLVTLVDGLDGGGDHNSAMTKYNSLTNTMSASCPITMGTQPKKKSSSSYYRTID